jgi:hypothetical protein
LESDLEKFLVFSAGEVYAILLIKSRLTEQGQLTTMQSIGRVAAGRRQAFSGIARQRK